MEQNNFERYVKYMTKQGQPFTQNAVAWDCGCSIRIVSPQPTTPQVDLGVGYVINPCAKHPRGWDELRSEA